jgi:hypothetical protein
MGKLSSPKNQELIFSLKEEDLIHISSNYIREGRLCEKWKINSITINGNCATMVASMLTIYSQGADSDRFHLSIYLAEEMASQLMVIYGHVWAGLSEKKEEVWMLESHTKSIKAITNSAFIQVEMEVPIMRKRGNTIYGIGKYRITDDRGGLIELEQKGILA